MNKQRKTSNILNVFQYDETTGAVTLPSTLVLTAPAGSDNSTKVPTTAWTRSYISSLGYVTGNQSISITGDATGSGSTSIELTLANTAVTPGTYGSATLVPVVTVDSKGRITNVSTASISGALTFIGDVTGTGTTGSSTSLTLANSGVTAGTYTKVTVDSKGRVTVGASATTSDIAEGTNLYYTDARVLAYLGANNYATQSYVGTQIANLVDSAPGTLDTLNELAAALGDDPNFATTIATSIGTKQAQLNGTGFVKVSGTTVSYDNNTYLTSFTESDPIYTASSWYTTTNNATNWNTAYGWGNHASAGYLTTASAASTYVSLTGSYANPAWITSLAYSKITGVPAFLTSYTETDTLSSVTARGSSTSTAITLNVGGNVVSTSTWEKWKLVTTGVTAPARQGSDGNGLNFTSNALWNSGWSQDDSTKKSMAYIQHLGNGRHEFRTSPSGGTVSWTTSLTIDETGANFNVPLTVSSNTVYHSGNLTNLNQLTNGPGYITSYSETDTLNSVTSRGNSTSNVLYIDQTTGGGYVFRTSNSWGGWGRNAFSISDGSNNLLATLGGYGGSGTSLSYAYIGLAYNNNWITFSSSAVNSQVALQQSGNQVLHAGNYNSYSPTLTGGGASGTWGISITGNAATVGGYSVSGSVGANTVVIRDSNNYIYAYYINSSVSESENPTINSFFTSNGDGWLRKSSLAHVRSQLGNYGGWITSYTETDTLASVVARGNTTSGSIAVGYASIPNGRLYVNSSTSLDTIAIQSTTTGTALAFADNTTPTWANAPRIVGVHNDLYIRTLATNRVRITDGGNTWLYGDLYLGSTNTKLAANTATGYLTISGSGSNYIGIGPYNNNGWGYFENFNNSNGTYYYVSAGRHAFDGGDVTPYSNNARNLGTGTYRWSTLYTYGIDTVGSLVNNVDGAVIIESNATENNNWLWKENSKAWGLFWFNRGSQAGQTIGGYTTVGAELMFMGGSNGIAMPSGWTGYYSGSYIAAMISNYNGYIYSASTVFAASDMRAPIFYDSNDTGYYLDPNGVSNLSAIRIPNTDSYATIMAGLNNSSRIYADGNRKAIVINADYYPALYLNAFNGTNTNHGAYIVMSGTLSAGGFRQWTMGIANYDPGIFSIGYNDNMAGNGHYGTGDNWSGSDAHHGRLIVDTSGNTKIRGMLYVNGTSGGMTTGNAVIHAGNIGSQSVSNSSSLGGYGSSTYIGKFGNGNGYYQADNWIQMNTSAGMFWPSYNGAHIYPNTATSYGSMRIDGTRNSWRGLNFGGSVTLMMNDNETGHYKDGYGWQWRWYQGSMFVSRGTYGGSTEYTVIDSGTIGSQSVSNATTIAGVGVSTIRGGISSNNYDFYVNGDANTYYPVVLSLGGQYGMHRYSISRGYSDPAPWDPIGTGSHRGGLTLTFDASSDIAWGGNDKSWRIIQFAEQYTNMVAGMALPVTDGIIVWLRGGGAYYRFHGPSGINHSATVYYSGYSAANGAVYGVRTNLNSVDGEIRAKWPIRGYGDGAIYVANNEVLHLGNYISYMDKLYYQGSQRLWTGSDGTRNSGWAYHQDNNTGIHWPNNGWHFYPKDASDMYVRAGSSSNVSLVMNTAGTNRGYVYADSSNQIGFLNNDRNWIFRMTSGGDAYAVSYYSSASTSKYLTSNTSSYTTWYVGGNNNGYSGFRVDGGMCLMMHTNGASGPTGFWLNNWSILTYVDSAQYLYHNGNEKFRTDGGGIYVTGTVYATGDVIAYYSDARLKKDVEVIDSAISKIQKLRGVTYTWNDEKINVVKERAGTKDIGLIAQEVEAVEPLFITEYQSQLNTPSNDPEEAKNFVPEMSETYKTIKYEKLVALLVEGMKEQQKQIEELQNKLDNVLSSR